MFSVGGLYSILYLFSILFVISTPKSHSIHPNIFSLERIHVDNQTLTVTSFQFNPYSNPSDWIDRIFGSKSIYTRLTSPTHVYSVIPPGPEEINERFENVRKQFQLPSSAIFPTCSIEILAYGLVDVSHPLSKAARSQIPSFGTALLRFLRLYRSPVSCYYRGVYENWRLDSQLTDSIYWPILVYCPIQNATTCKKLRDYNTIPSPTIPIKLVIHLENVKWTNHFRARLFPENRPVLTPTTIYTTKSRGMVSPSITLSKISTMSNIIPSPQRIGVCLVIPYVSIDENKRRANAAILIDWVRYYMRLNFLVMIYDRDHSNYDNIFQNPRYKLSEDIVHHSNLVYYNFTINGLLIPSSKGMKYDNSELPLIKDVKRNNVEYNDARLRKLRFESQGHDKTLTLTHCRFEAKAVFGIDTVLVVDFDEFLYCPQGGANSNSQSQYIQEYIAYQRQLNIDQISFPQRFIANRTVSTKSCIMDKVKTKASIFDCLAPYYYYMGGHSIKSVHIGHKCPLTGYHQSCPTETTPRSYDCLCVNKNLRHILPWRGRDASNEGRECGVVHLSLNDDNYIKFKYPMEEIQNSHENEIGQILKQSSILLSTTIFTNEM